MLKNFINIRTLGKYIHFEAFLIYINLKIGEGSFGTVYLVRRRSDD